MNNEKGKTVVLPCGSQKPPATLSGKCFGTKSVTTHPLAAPVSPAGGRHKYVPVGSTVAIPGRGRPRQETPAPL